MLAQRGGSARAMYLATERYRPAAAAQHSGPSAGQNVERTALSRELAMASSDMGSDTRSQTALEA